MPYTFYDRSGFPSIYTEDDEHLYDFSGNPIAYISENSIYNYRGRHLGWFDNGWIKDSSGNCFLFSEIASGGPLKPLKKLKPLKSLKKLKPIKGLKQLKPLKPLSTLNWSIHTINDFF
ncbi:4-fold beta flower protein [Polluticaenibacter yanchengensis]|uniref:4-fold beta flower domain-containing protein n=1 Tax=Polluticaenibacter yanchengensis TaxID=3014562 RepID=A0ABT4UNB1_9BACT|nr:hypothetical protein [Chitinophagaceae bacterium LY-5]